MENEPQQRAILLSQEHEYHVMLREVQKGVKSGKLITKIVKSVMGRLNNTELGMGRGYEDLYTDIGRIIKANESIDEGLAKLEIERRKRVREI